MIAVESLIKLVAFLVLLFFVLLTGTIAVFQGELTYWLTPEARSGLKPE